MSINLNICIEKLLKARKAYYETGNPIMSDQEYDALEDLIRQNDPNHPIFEQIGQKPSTAWKKADHSIPMGSLKKCHTEEEFLKWSEKYKEEVMIIQHKLDGLSLSLVYEDSKFIAAITRGNGFEGEDISVNVQLMKNFKQTLNIPEYYGAIRAEIILEKETFEKINSILENDNKYSNPRNAASGISRALDGRFCKHLKLICYDLAEDLDESEKIKKLINLGLEVPHQIIGKIPEIIETYKTYNNFRSNLPYGIDGAVIKINSCIVQKSEGSVQNRPKAQIAWKFDPPGAITVLERVTWEIGRTGVVTPLGHVSPVEIDGSIISKVTLHNIAEISRLGVGLKDSVMLVKSGDIIPKIVSVIETAKIPIEIPTECPCCKKILSNNGIQLFCENTVCPAKELQRIMHFIKTVKIDEFGESLAENLFNSGKLKNISDIFRLKKEDISLIEGWGEKSASIVIENINSKRVMPPELFLASLGIPTVSTSTAEDLWNKYRDLDKILNVTVEDLCSIKGYSTISSEKIVEGLKDNHKLIIDLKSCIDFEKCDNKGKLSGYSFCFTGAMSKPRTFFQNLVVKYGGKNFSTVTKDLSFLVCNENKGSSKSQKAQKFGVRVINENEFLSMCEVQFKDEPKTKIITPSLFE